MTSENTTGRYANLLAVSTSMRSYGRFLRLIAIFVGILGLFGAVVVLGVGREGPGLTVAVLIGVVGLLAALIVHASGTFIAAAGEGLLALADVATNTAKLASTGSTQA